MSVFDAWTNSWNGEIKERMLHGDYSYQRESEAYKPTWNEIRESVLKNLSKGVRFILFCVLTFSVFRFAAWGYMSVQLARARSHGVYPTAEEGMRQILEDEYIGIKSIDIFYAGPDSLDGKNPHTWYVIAEVHASGYADGSAMKKNGCDAPGKSFFQTHEGWIQVSQGVLSVAFGQWMSDFGLAGPGQSTPSTDRIGNRSIKFCQYP